MAAAEGLIFDVDGTLYPAADDLPFYESNFGKIIYANTISFFQNQLGLDEDGAIGRYNVLRASPGPLGKAIEEAIRLATRAVLQLCMGYYTRLIRYPATGSTGCINTIGGHSYDIERCSKYLGGASARLIGRCGPV